MAKRTLSRKDGTDGQKRGCGAREVLNGFGSSSREAFRHWPWLRPRVKCPDGSGSSSDSEENGPQLRWTRLRLQIFGFW